MSLCLCVFSHRYWEDLPLRRAAVSTRQPLGGGVQQLSLHQRQSGLYKGRTDLLAEDMSLVLDKFLTIFWTKRWLTRPDPVSPGAVWSPPLPAPAVGPAAVLPCGTGVSKAQLPHLLVPPVPPVGGLLHRRTLAPPSHHQVPAEQRASGQQLCPHNTCFQQRQSSTSESCPRRFPVFRC